MDKMRTNPRRGEPVPLSHPDCFFVDGEWVAPEQGAMFDVIQPATEEVYFRVGECGPMDMAAAAAAARRAFDAGPWPRMSHDERAQYLRAIAGILRTREADIAQLWTSEVGVVTALATAGAAGISKVFDFYASLASDYPFAERHHPTAGGALGLLVREPVGVVAAIIPWNAPMGIIANKVAPALLAGCTIVLKPSPEAPGAAYLMAEVAGAADLPPGVLNVVTADREVSELLVRDPRVDKISFTGSTAAGRRIGAICGDRIARASLELGGKSAAVLLDDYDLETAARSISTSARAATGQVCASLTRIIVSRRRHDEFLEALSDTFARTRVGDPSDPATEMGPLAMERQRDKVERYIAVGREEGATLATGGGRPAQLERGYFIEPTVFGHVDNGWTIAREEIFGPVLSVIPADDESHAVRLANDSIYGLNASVFTHDADRALTVARELKSGTVGHNAFRSDFGIAFGGFKQSGVGRKGGREGLLPYLEAKTIILDAQPAAGL
jgi:aldehyde dehydrogenase (NAD+)